MPTEAEPSIIRYLKRILRTIMSGLAWMLLQVIAGIMPGYAFLDNGFTWKNGAYYVGFLLSTGVLVYYLYRLWRKPLFDDEDNQPPPGEGDDQRTTGPGPDDRGSRPG